MGRAAARAHDRERTVKQRRLDTGQRADLDHDSLHGRCASTGGDFTHLREQRLANGQLVQSPFTCS
jgi:hypothetical protein